MKYHRAGMFGEFGESFVIVKPKPFNFVPIINNLLADLFIRQH